jgi:DNA polymerase III delta prime subunit
MSREPLPEVRYEKAVRGNVATLTMFAGPSGSGKTKSALRLATGLAGPDGWIAACDTEHGRMLYYADPILDPDYPVPEAFGSFGEHEKT